MAGVGAQLRVTKDPLHHFHHHWFSLKLKLDCSWGTDRGGKKTKQKTGRSYWLFLVPRPFFPHRPMRDEVASDLWMIDGPCKYGYYHVGSLPFCTHYSLSGEATVPPPPPPILCNLALQFNVNIEVWRLKKFGAFSFKTVPSEILEIVQKKKRSSLQKKTANSSLSFSSWCCVIAFVAAVECLPSAAINAWKWNTSSCKIHMSVD